MPRLQMKPIIILSSKHLNIMNQANLVEMMVQNKNYQAHRKKLAQIMSSSSVRATVGSFDARRREAINSFYNNRDKAAKQAQKARREEVDRQNDIIIRKLVEVNSRKNTMVGGKFQTISHNSMANMKKSMQSIDQQNQKIAHKLVTTNSNLRQEKLFESFKKHLERRDRIKKYQFDDEVGMIVPKKIKSMQKLRSLGENSRVAYQSRERQNQENQVQP